jgi:ribosomal protein L34
MSHTHHLAQINLARMIAPLDDPRMTEFVAQLGPINALADRSPGFVWRLQSETGSATDVLLRALVARARTDARGTRTVGRFVLVRRRSRGSGRLT